MDLEKGLQAMRELADSVKSDKEYSPKGLDTANICYPWDDLCDEDWESFLYECDFYYQCELRKDKGQVRNMNEIMRMVWDKWERKR